MAGRAGYAAARMTASAAHIQPLKRPAIRAVSQHRPCGPKLIEAHIAVHDVAARQTKFALQSFGTQNLSAKD